MSALGLMILFAFSANLVLGALVLIAYPRRNVNQSYLLMATLVGTWQYFIWRGHAAADMETAAWAIRMASAATALFPIGAHLLRQAILHPGDHLGRLLLRIRWLVLLGIVVAGLCASPYFILRITMPRPSDPAWIVPDPEYSFINYIFMAYFLAAVTWLLWLFVRDRRTTRGIAQVEIGFILLGVAASLFVGSFGSMIVPLVTGSSQSVPLSNSISILIMTSIIAYGVATRRIMDMAALMRRAVAYVLLALFLAALYMVVFLAVDGVAAQFLVGAGFLPHLSAMLAVVFVMLPAQGRMNQVARQLFVDAHTVDIPSVKDRATALCESVNRLDDLLRLFSDLVTEAWGAEFMAVLLRDEKGFFIPSYRTPGADPGLRFDPDDPVIARATETRAPVQVDALRRRRLTVSDRHIVERLQQLGVEMVIGIFHQNTVQGILVLGPRADGRLFDRVAQDTLAQLAHQLAVAIENARLYTQVQDAKIYHEVLVDSLVNGVLAVNVEGRLTVCNREALRLLGLPSQEAEGWPMTILPEPLQRILQDALHQALEVRDLEITLLRAADGEAVPLRVGSAFIRGHEGAASGALLVFQDLTAIRKLETQLRRSDRLASIGTLAAGMAHEIKNPLVSIQTFAQLLPEQFDDPDFRSRFAPLVLKEVARIDTLVTGLLTFARPARPKMTPVQLHGILDHALQLCEQGMRNKHIQQYRAFTASTDRIMGDSNLLVQVFLNLCLNALEAMSAGGTLTISTENRVLPHTPPVHAICVRVTDTGRGIAEEDISRVFDPFFTTRDNGTGLGLSIAHGIIQQHGGTVDLESEINEGTSFQLTFPLLPETAA